MLDPLEYFDGQAWLEIGGVQVMGCACWTPNRVAATKNENNLHKRKPRRSGAVVKLMLFTACDDAMLRVLLGRGREGQA